ncbi:gamma-type small acid-soluble spore protein [Peribacillus simplex]|nr:gamma-type small acid-soluble spore protein [Peribacillus simplex]
MEKKNQAGNVKQNAGQFGTEFASETNAQEVRKQNQQTKSRKK